MADTHEFQGASGSLLHLVQCARPEIALPVGELAAFQSAPMAAHHAALLVIVRHVGGTAARGFTCKRSTQPLGFWCNANFAACLDTGRSPTGWVVMMYGGAVSCVRNMQATEPTLPMDTEYQACGATASEGCCPLRHSGICRCCPQTFHCEGQL
jgi:hypothetical protein